MNEFGYYYIGFGFFSLFTAGVIEYRNYLIEKRLSKERGTFSRYNPGQETGASTNSLK